MNMNFVIEGILLKRRGVDILAREYKWETCYAQPSASEIDGGYEDRSLEI